MSFADKIADLAAKATKGQWVNHNPTHGGDLYAIDPGDEDTRVAARVKRDDLNYIALLNPSVGLAIARALKAAAQENQRLKAFIAEAWNRPSSQVSFSIDDEAAINLDGASQELDAALAALEAMETP